MNITWSCTRCERRSWSVVEESRMQTMTPASLEPDVMPVVCALSWQATVFQLTCTAVRFWVRARVYLVYPVLGYANAFTYNAFSYSLPHSLTFVPLKKQTSYPVCLNNPFFWLSYISFVLSTMGSVCLDTNVNVHLGLGRCAQLNKCSPNAVLSALLMKTKPTRGNG